MANRLYLLSSLCFLTGALLAFREIHSAINAFYVAGSALFVGAAGMGVLGGRRR